MSRIPRYVLLELLSVFLFALTGITVIVIFGLVAQEAIRQGLGLEPMSRLLIYLLPEALRFAIPATILFAACAVYGRLSADNEVLAARSAGVSPLKLIVPGLALAFLVSLAAVWVNELAVTWGRQGAYRVVVQSVEQIAYGMLRSQGSYSAGRVSINVKEVNGRTLERPTLLYAAGEGKPPVLYTARAAELRSNLAEGTLSIFLYDSHVQVGDELTAWLPGTVERVVPLSAVSKKGEISRGPSECPMSDLPQEKLAARRRIFELEQLQAAEAAYHLTTGDFAALTDEAWQQRAGEINDLQRRLYRLQTESWRRWAHGFSCFFFMLVGAPWAISRRSSDVANTFFACFLPILLFYYPFLMLGVDRAKSGAFPPYAVWLGNAALLLAGAVLVRRMLRG